MRKRTLQAILVGTRSKFVEDLRESVAEMDEMEALRLEAELEKQRASITSVSSPSVTAAPGAAASSPSAVANGDAKKANGSAISAGAVSGVPGGGARGRPPAAGGGMRHQGATALSARHQQVGGDKLLPSVVPVFTKSLLFYSPSPTEAWCSVARPSTTPSWTCRTRLWRRKWRVAARSARSTRACPFPSSPPPWGPSSSNSSAATAMRQLPRQPFLRPWTGSSQLRQRRGGEEMSDTDEDVITITTTLNSSFL